jgi:hypothetical protein
MGFFLDRVQEIIYNIAFAGNNMTGSNFVNYFWGGTLEGISKCQIAFESPVRQRDFASDSLTPEPGIFLLFWLTLGWRICEKI